MEIKIQREQGRDLFQGTQDKRDKEKNKPGYLQKVFKYSLENKIAGFKTVIKAQQKNFKETRKN